jgi:hypothetical protein
MKALDMPMPTARTLLRRPLVFGQVFGEADDGGGVTPWVANTTLRSGGIGGDGQTMWPRRWDVSSIATAVTCVSENLI